MAIVITLLVAIPFVLPQSVYRSWFVSQLQSGLNLKFDVETFRLTLLPLPSLTLKNVKIYSVKDPFADQLLAETKKISADVALSPLLSKKAIVSLSLEEPILYFRTAKEGSNFSDLIIKKEGGEKKTTWQLSVTSFQLEKGHLQYFPEGAENPKYTLQNVALRLKNLALAGKSSIPLTLSLGLLGGSDNFSLKGDIEIDLDRKKFSTDNLQGKLGSTIIKLRGNFDAQKMSASLTLRADAAKLDGATLSDDFPAIYEHVLNIEKGDVPLFDDLFVEGNLSWTLKGLAIGGTLHADRLTYQNYPLKTVKIDFYFTPPRLDIHSLKATVFEAPTTAKGFVRLAKPLHYQCDLNLAGVDLTQIGFLKKQIQGKGSLNASLLGKVIAKRNPVQDLNAVGNIMVTHGSIPSLKLGEAIFGSSLWNILSPVAGFNKEKLNNLKGLDATVEQLTIPFVVEGGKTKIPNARWQNPRYQIQMNGAIGLNQTLSGSGAFLLSSKETQELIKNEDIRKTLSDKEGELELPFLVSGTFENPKMEPDKKTLTPRFTKAMALRGIDFLKQQLNPVDDVKEGENALEAPVKILKGIFGK